VVLAAVAPQEQGQASGVAGTVRELAAVLGVAVLGSVLAGHAGTGTHTPFAAAVGPALWLAAAIAATGAVIALAVPRNPSPQAAPRLPTPEENLRCITGSGATRRPSSAAPPTRNAA
jgi:TRAP-type mannitol/chloroaromatic compound transport system permease large subunit